MGIHFIKPIYEVAIVGTDWDMIRKSLDKNYLPDAIFLGGKDEGTLNLLENKLVPGQTTIYVCVDKTCKIPVYDVRKSLAANEMNNKYKAGFINDLDGGQQFFPIWTNREGDIWIDFVEAIDMKSRPAVDFSGVNATFDPIKKQKLLNFVGGLQPDDNPVLRIVYLKQSQQGNMTSN